MIPKCNKTQCPYKKALKKNVNIVIKNSQSTTFAKASNKYPQAMLMVRSLKVKYRQLKDAWIMNYYKAMKYQKHFVPANRLTRKGYRKRQIKQMNKKAN